MNIPTFKAFRSNNYRLYFFGQSISLIGTWMERTAVYWLVYTKTQSAFIIGMAVFASQFPAFLFSPLGGVVSDRNSRYRVMLITQAASLVQALLLAVVVMFTDYNVWEILFLSLLLGIINGFDVPARQSLVNEMVSSREDLPNAIALNSTMFNMARLIGPAISGIVLEAAGAGVCFLLNALSFVAVIISLKMMKLPKYIPHPHKKEVMKEFKEGWMYLKETPAIRNVVLMLAFTSLLVLPFITLLPVYAKEIFKGNASTYGYLNSFIGLGAMGGAIFLASLKAGSDLRKTLVINLLIFGSGLILFAYSTSLALALAFAAISGFGMMAQTTLSNTIIQTSVPHYMRGRILGYFAMAFFGMQPLGSLLIGSVSHYITAPHTILAEGIAGIIIALVFLPLLRKDILKEKDEIALIELEDPTVAAEE